MKPKNFKIQFKIIQLYRNITLKINKKYIFQNIFIGLEQHDWLVLG